jgi:hypothetical protein
MRPVDPRLLRHAAAARGYLTLTVGLGLATTALILAQAGLLAHALATRPPGRVWPRSGPRWRCWRPCWRPGR